MHDRFEANGPQDYVLDPITEAAVSAATDGGAPPMEFLVSPDAFVELAEGRNPFDGMSITGWVR